MRRFMVGGKRSLIVIIALVALAALSVVGYMVVNRSKEPDQPTEDLQSVLTRIAPVSAPDENYTNELSAYLEKTSSNEEKAKGYKILADAYSVNGKFNQALDSYKKAKELEAYGNFTDEEKTTIDQEILALEYQVQVNSGPARDLEGGFREPNE